MCGRSANGSMNCQPCGFDMCFNCAEKATPPSSAPVSSAAPVTSSAPAPVARSTPTPAASAPSSAPPPSSPAVDNLEGKKKWIRMAFDGKDPYTSEPKVTTSSYIYLSYCFFQLKDFENAFNQCRGSLDANYTKQTEQYIADLTNGLAGMKLSKEWGNKPSQWKSQLTRIENMFDSYLNKTGMPAFIVQMIPNSALQTIFALSPTSKE